VNLSIELSAIRDEALQVSCESWAAQQGWRLRRAGGELTGPCPKCGGTDRFSINLAKNIWICRNCSVGGDVIFLVQHIEGLRFAEACERLAGRRVSQPPNEEEARRRREAQKASEEQAARENERYRVQAHNAARSIWKASQPVGEVALSYLRLRGLGVDFLGRLSNVRFAPQLGYVVAGKVIWRGPALLAKIDDAEGHGIGVHRTWIDLDQPKGKLALADRDGVVLPAKKVLGSKKGGAIRLHTPLDARRIVMGEGIETTLTALVHAFEFETAYWAGVDLGNMAGKALRGPAGGQIHDQPDMSDLDCFLPPAWVEELVYLCDGDEPEKHTVEKVRRGLRRALRLRAMARAELPDLPALSIKMVPPGEAGTDLNSIAMADAALVDDEPAEGDSGD
jgi:hypothetical protein